MSSCLGHTVRPPSIRGFWPPPTGFEVQDEKGKSRAAIGEKKGRTVFDVLDKDGAALVKTEKR